MIQKFTIPFRLESLNVRDSLNRAHWGKGAELEKQEKARCLAEIRVQRVKPCRRFPVALSLVYHGSGKRDLDNMDAHARKVILDALVQAGTIPDDSPKYVDRLEARFKQGKDERIDVTVVEPDAGGDGLPGYSGGEICELQALNKYERGE